MDMSEMPQALEAAGPALRSLMNDPAEDVWVRVGAARSLGLLVEELAAVQLLASFVQQHGVAISVRVAAARALTELGRTDIAVLGLRELAAEGDGSDFDRLHIAVVLHECGERPASLEIFDELRGCLRHNDILKHELPMTLERLGELDAAVSCCVELAVDHDVEGFKKTHAIAALGRSQTPEALAALLALVRSPITPADVRLSAASALCEQGEDPDARSAFLALTSEVDPDPFIAMRAAEALLTLPERDRAIRVIADLATNRSLPSNVRIVAARTLGDVGGPLATATVEGLVDEPDGTVRAEVACSLGRLGQDAHAVSVALVLLAGEEIDVYWKRSLVHRLSELDDPRVRPALKELAHDPNESDQVRLAAAASLATASDDEEGRLLVAFATDPSGEVAVRVLAADRLTELGGRAAVDALDRMAHDAELSRATDEAIVGLGRLGGSTAVSKLAALAGDPTRSVVDRFFAAEALVPLAPALAIEPLIAVALDSEAMVLTRTKALALLGSLAGGAA